jgi:hypothetical protein
METLIKYCFILLLCMFFSCNYSKEKIQVCSNQIDLNTAFNEKFILSIPCGFQQQEKSKDIFYRWDCFRAEQLKSNIGYIRCFTRPGFGNDYNSFQELCELAKSRNTKNECFIGFLDGKDTLSQYCYCYKTTEATDSTVELDGLFEFKIKPPFHFIADFSFEAPTKEAAENMANAFLNIELWKKNYMSLKK